MSAESGRIRKISVSISGHSTSISLEAAFLDALKALALEQGRSVAALIAEIDAKRGEANLSSAIRVFLLEHFRAQNRQGAQLTPDSAPPAA